MFSFETGEELLMHFIAERVFLLPDALIIRYGDGIGCLFRVGDDCPIEVLGDHIARLFLGEVGFIEGQDVGLLGELVCCLAQLFSGGEADSVNDVLVEVAKDSVVLLKVF